MVYSNKFVMCVLVNGTPQEELSNGVVNLPFGTEYALRFRNKNNRRALVKIYIDGENVSDGGYIVPANNHVDIKRHISKDNAFKFVSLDSVEALDHGKNGPNHEKIKGTIEARFFLEKECCTLQGAYSTKYPDHAPAILWKSNNSQTSIFGKPRCLTYNNSKMLGGSSFQISCDSSPVDTTPLQNSCIVDNTPLQDGCTVEGTSTGQSFVSSYINCETNYTLLKIFLQGFNQVEKAQKSKNTKACKVEAENEELRLKIAQLENDKLKQQLAQMAPQPKKKKLAKKKPKLKNKK